jgi:hypothetical protein
MRIMRVVKEKTKGCTKYNDMQSSAETIPTTTNTRGNNKANLDTPSHHH